MSSISSGNAEQYSDSRKLAARGRLNRKYTIAETPWFRWVAERLPIGAGSHVLDTGCGPGWFWNAAVQVLPEGLHLTLSDLSDGMVEEATARCQELPFASINGMRADAADLPFADATFDAAIAMHMLYHLPDPEKGIAEIHRVLKPGGVLAVTTNGKGNMRALYELTTVFGSPPTDPSATAFGFDAADGMMKAQFGNVAREDHPATLRVTEPEDVFLALTSYPPGDTADENQLAAFRAAIDETFARGNGVLETDKESALFISRKTG